MRRALTLLSLVLLTSCDVPETVGSIECATNADCAPPETICGIESRCVDGCPGLACAAGSVCTESTGECAGGIIGTACITDVQCDPPDIVCRAATSTCAASCDLTGACPAGLACNHTTGRCCDADDPSCQATMSDLGGCQDDDDCAAPGMICAHGACVPGCATAGCTAPKACDATSGHCVALHCARDSECDDDSRCTQTGMCVVLRGRSYGDCMGGTKVSYDCASKKTADEFVSCAGPAGKAACPYCIDDSCFTPGLCNDDDDCDAGLACTGGLCLPTSPQCPMVQTIEDISSGAYAVGKAVCVRAMVTSVRSGYDGAIEIRLGSSPYLYADVLPMFQTSGVKLPTVGDTVTVHGFVRWDEGHDDRELLPVDWIGP